MRGSPWGPLAQIAAAVAGILFGERAGPAPAVASLVLGIVIWSVVLFARASGARTVLTVVAAGIIASALTQRALDGTAHSALSAPIEARASVTISGSLVEDPAGGPYSARVLVRVARIDGRRAGNRTTLVSARGDPAARLRLLEAGDRVALSGWLEPLSGFDERLRWRHAVAHLHAIELTNFAPPTSPLMRVANDLRDRVLQGGAYLPATERALVAGFLLGDTRQLPRDVEEQFRAAGLTHLLAVSGANVA